MTVPGHILKGSDELNSFGNFVDVFQTPKKKKRINFEHYHQGRSSDVHQLCEGFIVKTEEWLYLCGLMIMPEKLTKVKQIQFSQLAFMVG